jgi:hypothetical protein
MPNVDAHGSGAEQVDVDHPLPFLGGDIVELAAGVDTRGGEHAVDASADPLGQRTHRRIDRSGIREISAFEGDVVIEVLPVDDQRRTTVLCHRFHGRRTEARCASGDQNVAQCHVSAPSRSVMSAAAAIRFDDE